MMMNRWLIVTATGTFVEGGGYEPIVPNAQHSVVTLPPEASPDLRNHRWDGTAVVAKSAAELAAYDATLLSTRSQATSRQKDILAMCACAVRGRNVAAWTAMTVPQKIAAVLAEADVFKNMRDFVETNVNG
jgi:hypothetical protein